MAGLTPKSGGVKALMDQRASIAAEAKRRSLADDGKTSLPERFALRNAIRAEQGLPPEERQRGGVAGFYDTNKGALPVAAALAAPFLLPSLGGAGAAAGGAGTAASTAGVALPTAIPAAASGGGGFLGTLGGIAGKVAGALDSPTGQMLTKLGTAAYGIGQQNKANTLTKNAIAADQARWQAGAPLRDAGRDRLLNPTVADRSSLTTLSRRGNPFAVPAGGY